MKPAIPYIHDLKSLPKDGSLCKTHNFCRQVFNSKCKAHYQKCQSNKGFHTCPYGFATYVSENNNSTKIYSSLRGIRIIIL